MAKGNPNAKFAPEDLSKGNAAMVINSQIKRLQGELRRLNHAAEHWDAETKRRGDVTRALILAQINVWEARRMAL